METQLFRTMDTLSATLWFIGGFEVLTGKASIGEEIGETHGCGCEVVSRNEEKKGRKRAVCCGLRWEVRVLGINEEAQEKKRASRNAQY